VKNAKTYLSLAALAYAFYKVATSKRVCVSAGPFKICND
jgi:hypothetical protein